MFGEIYNYLYPLYDYCRYLVWEKTNPTPSIRKKTWRQSTELIIHAHNKDDYNFIDQNYNRNVLKENTCSHETLPHPTQKPIKLIKKVVEIISNKDDLILDPFAGSGTTAIACHDLKRNFICIEKEPEYHAIATKRYNEAKAQLTLF